MPKSKRKTRRKERANSRGVFEGHSGGFGFVSTPVGEFFIPKRFVNGAFDGDIVEIAPINGNSRFKPKRSGAKGASKGSSSKRDHRREAKVIRAIERAHSQVIGRYEIAGPFGVVIPEDRRICHDVFTLREESPDVEDGSIVRVTISQYPTKNSYATGVISEVIASNSDEMSPIDRIIAKYDFDVSFSKEAQACSDGAKLDIEECLAFGYRDIRDRFVFTIDPVDAKDFDDALSIDSLSADQASGIEAFDFAPISDPIPKKDADLSRRPMRSLIGKRDRFYRIGIHIADVSHYVQWASPLDEQARKRATSIYLPDRVIPMLPENLSNGLCSLKPREPRLAMTVDVFLGSDFVPFAYDIYDSVIESSVRMNYDEALSILEAKNGQTVTEALGSSQNAASIAQCAEDVASRLHLFRSFSKDRERLRLDKGGIEFETKEARVVLDDEGHPTGIDVREKNAATGLVEESMIFANEITASHLEIRKWPCVYRDHETPDAEALAQLSYPLEEFKWFTKEMKAKVISGNPKAIQRLLDKCKGRAEYELVTMLVLRCMSRAIYSPKNLGHYGLGLRSYCHFTSPIRRYPDLMVHRMLKANLNKRPGIFDQQANALSEISERSSVAEKEAEQASFDAQRAMMTEYMSQFIGQSFKAIITGVMQFGVFVRLDNCAEGLVPVRELGREYFYYDEKRYSLTGSETNRVFKLGQMLNVRLVEADMDEGRMDFALASDDAVIS